MEFSLADSELMYFGFGNRHTVVVISPYEVSIIEITDEEIIELVKDKEKINKFITKKFSSLIGVTRYLYQFAQNPN